MSAGLGEGVIWCVTGLPAVIVSVVVIIDHNMYGRASLDKSRPNETTV